MWINDTYGHFVENEALVHTSGQPRTCVADLSTIAPYRGRGTFVLRHWHTTRPRPFAIASPATPIRPDMNASPSAPQISIGLVCDLYGKLDLLTLTGQSNRALYTAKNAGHNQVSQIRHGRVNLILGSA
ncbi:MAG: diguanylate cyclase [Rhodobacteraceae bacterium]|nr:diguanylate cyclase [Paracoccaceae bacterium]